ncbi:DNA internalization-related competence protein ComEC/Rec2 [uncultured Peptoniphilus sp.]|uniref:DNA internalization-related competence protein ComEC/Rec2 n=1 Tax=uncultured Peptoniphilus sp. TaxID=254354 RepID=UPI002805A641|nr:DNA internalization-related competence protein ComEC/Rec2 [uncultured Peptoniphilus sp.]
MYLLSQILGIIIGINLPTYFFIILFALPFIFIKEKKYKLSYIIFLFSLIISMTASFKVKSFEGNIVGKVVMAKEDRFVLKTSSINGRHKKIKILFFGPASRGDILSIDGSFSNFLPAMNRGNFNREIFYKSQGIDLSGKIYHMDKIRDGEKFYKFLGTFKNFAKNNIDRSLDNRQARILKTILLSDKSFLDPEDGENFKDLGISHVLAISGFHISILFALLSFTFKRLFSSVKISDFLTFFIIGLYLFLVDFPVGGIRAFAFLFFYRLRFYLKTNISSKEILNSTAMLMLLINPYAIFSLSFLMSYGAVVGIFYIYPKISYRLPGDFLILKSFALTFSVLIIIFPIINYYFGGVSLFIFLANFILVPLYSGVITLGYILILGLRPLGFLINLIFKIIFYGEFFLLSLKDFRLNILAFNGGPIFLYYILVFFLLTYNKYYEIYYRARKYFMAYLFIIFIITGLTFVSDYNSLKEIHFYVDQGDASLISYKGKNYLIDVGGARQKNKIFESYLEPALKSLGIRKIDGVFISHFDEDHAGNLPKLVRSFKVKNIYSSYSDGIHKNYILKFGNFYKSGALKFTVLSEIDESDEANDKSMVLLLEFKGKKILYTGDVSSKIEGNLINIINGHIDILKVAHHGSSSSSSEEFLNKIRPKIGVISCGVNNSYGHPHKEALENLKNAGVKTFFTTKGEVDILLKKNFFRIKNYGKVNILEGLAYNIIFIALYGRIIKKYELQGNLQGQRPI